MEGLIILEDYISTQNIELCNGGSITVGNNTYNSTGLYTDVFSSINGCDKYYYYRFNSW